MLLKAMILLSRNEMLWIFLFLIIADFTTGYLKSWKWKVTSSDIGTKGVIKHTSTFIFYAFLIYIGYYFNIIVIAQALLALVMLTYGTSILENLGVMGVYVPKFLKNRIDREIRKYETMLGEADNEKG
nr:MAG TPA: holin [Caudoviricetes sp.]